MFRFTIRDLLWLTVVVALLVVWLLDRGRLTRPIVPGEVTVNVDDFFSKLQPGEKIIVSRGAGGEVSAEVVPTSERD